MKQKMKRFFSTFASAALFLGACTSSADPGYQSISASEAWEMMKKEENCVIVDVRSKEEFSEKHIPEAICIPVEEINDQMPAELPDKDQIILVYCRSGNRSKQASIKLAMLGYTNVCEFGGISSWPYETVRGNEDRIFFSSSSAEFTCVLDDPSVIHVDKEKRPEHPEENEHAEYTFTVHGLKPGRTQLRIEERSRETGNYDHLYEVTVEETLLTKAEKLTTENLDALAHTSSELVMELSGRNYYGSLEDNSTSRIFLEKLSSARLDTSFLKEADAYRTMHLPWDLPSENRMLSAKEGDLFVIDLHTMVLVMEDTEISGEKIAEFSGPFRECLEEDSTEVSFWIEWSE